MFMLCSKAKALNFLSIHIVLLWRVCYNIATNSDSEFSAMLYGRVDVTMLESV